MSLFLIIALGNEALTSKLTMTDQIRTALIAEEVCLSCCFCGCKRYSRGKSIHSKSYIFIGYMDCSLHQINQKTIKTCAKLDTDEMYDTSVVHLDAVDIDCIAN